jgi:hypothetical protein
MVKETISHRLSLFYFHLEAFPSAVAGKRPVPASSGVLRDLLYPTRDEMGRMKVLSKPREK